MPVRSLRPPAWLLAILSGLLLAPSFPAASWGPLAFGAFVPVLVALAGERRGFWPSFRLGWLFGFAFFVVLLYWIPRLPPENVTVPLLLYPALVLAALYCGVYVAAWGGLVGWLARGRPAALALLAPGFWIPIEIVRCSGVLGFPWGVIGGSQWTALDWIQVASIGGVHLLSFLIVLVNGFLAAAFLSPGWRCPAWLAAALLVMVLPWQWGKGERARWEATMPDIATVPVVLIQPNTGYDKWNAERRTAIITGLVQSTLEAARVTRDSTMIIWPETAAPTLLKWDEPNMALIRNAADVTGRPLFTGFPDRILDYPAETKGAARVRYYNAAGLFLPGDGLVEQQAKARLVPFAEWMPIPGLNRVNFGQANFTPAESLHVFTGGSAPFGVLICIESIFPAQSRALVRNGARFLVNVTNDQWFGRSAAPWQHLTLAVFRCVETRAGMARAANTGVSCLIDPVGRIRHPTPLFEPAMVAGEVCLAPTTPTFYVRHGDWILPAALALALLGAILGRRATTGDRR